MSALYSHVSVADVVIAARRGQMLAVASTHRTHTHTKAALALGVACHEAPKFDTIPTTLWCAVPFTSLQPVTASGHSPHARPTKRRQIHAGMRCEKRESRLARGRRRPVRPSKAARVTMTQGWRGWLCKRRCLAAAKRPAQFRRRTGCLRGCT